MTTLRVKAHCERGTLSHCAKCKTPDGAPQSKSGRSSKRQTRWYRFQYRQSGTEIVGRLGAGTRGPSPAARRIQGGNWGFRALSTAAILPHRRGAETMKFAPLSKFPKKQSRSSSTTGKTTTARAPSCPHDWATLSVAQPYIAQIRHRVES